jgi:hypothetical protein
MGRSLSNVSPSLVFSHSDDFEEVELGSGSEVEVSIGRGRGGGGRVIPFRSCLPKGKIFLIGQKPGVFSYRIRFAVYTKEHDSYTKLSQFVIFIGESYI